MRAHGTCSVAAPCHSMACLSMFYYYETINIDYRISSMITFLMICALLLIFPFYTTLKPALCTSVATALGHRAGVKVHRHLKLRGILSVLQRRVRGPISIFANFPWQRCCLRQSPVLQWASRIAVLSLWSLPCCSACTGSLLSEESSFVSVLYSSVVNSDHWSQCLNHLIKVYCFPTIEAVEGIIAVVKFVLCYCTQQVFYPK